jgi:hypothetical protein
VIIVIVVLIIVALGAIIVLILVGLFGKRELATTEVALEEVVIAIPIPTPFLLRTAMLKTVGMIDQALNNLVVMEMKNVPAYFKSIEIIIVQAHHVPIQLLT